MLYQIINFYIYSAVELCRIAIHFVRKKLITTLIILGLNGFLAEVISVRHNSTLTKKNAIYLSRCLFCRYDIVNSNHKNLVPNVKMEHRLWICQQVIGRSV